MVETVDPEPAGENADRKPLAPTPESLGAIPITAPERFPEAVRKAILAATQELESQEENPLEFFARIRESDDENVTVIELWHPDTFLMENLEAGGSSDDKSRIMYFDHRAGAITQTLYYQ